MCIDFNNIYNLTLLILSILALLMLGMLFGRFCAGRSEAEETERMKRLLEEQFVLERNAMAAYMEMMKEAGRHR